MPVDMRLSVLFSYLPRKIRTTCETELIAQTRQDRTGQRRVELLVSAGCNRLLYVLHIGVTLGWDPVGCLLSYWTCPYFTLPDMGARQTHSGIIPSLFRRCGYFPLAITSMIVNCCSIYFNYCQFVDCCRVGTLVWTSR